MESPYDSAIPLLGKYPRADNMYPHKNLCENVPNSFIYQGPQIETT